MKKKRPGGRGERPDVRGLVRGLAADLAGGALYSAGVYTFAKEGGFAPGGISGLALLADHLWGVPMGLTSALLNLPLIVWSLKTVGKRFLLRTARSVLICTLILDWIAPLIPTFRGQKGLSALLSGLFLGVGMAIFYQNGSSSGGTDLLCVAVHARFPKISLGSVTLVTDLLVIAAGWAVYGGTASLLCGILVTAVNAAVVDALCRR